MPNKTRRELERELEELRAKQSPDTPNATEVAVEWGEPDPKERPDGMVWSPGDPDADDEANRQATLQYDIWSAQQDALDRLQNHDDDVVAFLGGYGSGKSVFGARWLIAQALQYPGSRFLAMGVSFQEARKTTYPKFFAALPGDRTTRMTGDFNGPETSPIVDDYNRQNHRVTFSNDSVIVLGSADKYSRFAGAEFGGVWLDEPSLYGDTLHPLLGMLTTRLRSVDGPKKQLWTLTGEGYNAAWEILEKRQDADGEPIGLNINVPKASVLDNPYLPDAEKEAFKRQWGGTSKEKQALHGGFQAARGLVYSNFKRDRHVIPHTEAERRVDDSWRVYGYDAGYRDPRVVLEVGRTPQNQLIVLDEFHRREVHVDEAIRWLADRPEGEIVTEHAPSDVNRFEQAGWPTVNADKGSIEAGIADVRRRLEEDEHMEVPDATGPNIRSPRVTVPIAYDGDGRRTTARGDQESEDDGVSEEPEDEPTQAAVGLLVSERCENLIQEFQSYKEEEIGASSARDHCLDALRYIIHTSESAAGDDNTRERPDHHGVRMLG